MALLQVKQLTKSFGNVKVIDHINFALEHGRNIALIGENGAGKTTTMRMLTGLTKPSSGDIIFEDAVKDLREVIGYLPQHPVFHDWMTGQEYLDYVGKLAYVTAETRREKMTELLKLTGIYEAKDKRISKYSGGMKQRLGIAQALLHEPKLLILDEPVSALDPLGRREILTLMTKLKEKVTVLFSTHILQDAEDVCDDVILMHGGKVIEANALVTLKEKYQTTIIEIIFEHADEVFLEKIKAFPYVTDAHFVKNKLHIAVTDVPQAKSEILKVISEENWPIKMFRINEASLEDLFMKAVSK